MANTIIPPVDRSLLLRDLQSAEFVRKTRRAANEIYTFDAGHCPALMREVGRLREESFRAAGGGTGMPLDVDELDTRPEGYRQLIIWDPEALAVVGGYRYILCGSSRIEALSTWHYFHFSARFRRRYLPYMIELGRSFVQPLYQQRRNPKTIFALDNLWDGMGAIVMLHPEVKYLFGKVTMYPSIGRLARNTLIYFMRKHFPDNEQLVRARRPIDMDIDSNACDNLFVGKNYGENYRILIRRMRDLRQTIPPMINSYMRLSPTMRVFDTCSNPDFGNVEETGIMLTIGDFYADMRQRYLR
ncbi:MAG: GNAT family N-acetyltransferase [Alistipes sp.]|nr:GNAT family N-acetyltransferase [Alistipes sp.]